MHAADQITRPVLLVQGLEDTIVPPAQTRLMAEALTSTGIPHRYLTFQGEGHGFRRASSIKRAIEAELSLYRDAMTHTPALATPPNAHEPTEPDRS